MAEEQTNTIKNRKEMDLKVIIFVSCYYCRIVDTVFVVVLLLLTAVVVVLFSLLLMLLTIRTDAYDVLCFIVLSIDCFVVLFFYCQKCTQRILSSS